jgi:hypothetical protein
LGGQGTEFPVGNPGQDQPPQRHQPGREHPSRGHPAQPQDAHQPSSTYRKAQGTRDQGSAHVGVSEAARRAHGHDQQPPHQTRGLRLNLHGREEPERPCTNEQGRRSTRFEIPDAWSQDGVAQDQQKGPPNGQSSECGSGPQVRNEDRQHRRPEGPVQRLPRGNHGQALLQTVVRREEDDGNQRPRRRVDRPTAGGPIPEAPRQNQDQGRARESPGQGFPNFHGLLEQSLDEEGQFYLRTEGLRGEALHAELAAVDGQLPFEARSVAHARHLVPDQGHGEGHLAFHPT